MSKVKIKVLIVDDSAVVRQTLCTLLSSDPEIVVIGTANDPFAAAERIAEDMPDVITLAGVYCESESRTYKSMIVRWLFCGSCITHVGYYRADRDQVPARLSGALIAQ